MNKVKRRGDDGHLAECPLCGSLDIGGAHDTVNCYGCGLQITKPRPLQNAIDAWNMRGGEPLDAQTYDWVNIENCGLPPAGVWYDAFTYDFDGDRVVETLFFDGVNDTGVHWLCNGDWLEPVTHYKTHYTVSPPEGDEL